MCATSVLSGRDSRRFGPGLVADLLGGFSSPGPNPRMLTTSYVRVTVSHMKEAVISTRIEETLRDELARIAEKHDRTFSQEIRRALRLHVLAETVVADAGKTERVELSDGQTVEFKGGR